MSEQHSPPTDPSPLRYEKGVFVSYAWGGESERIVDELELAFVERNIHVVRDKKDLEYKGSIESFEQRISDGQCVILVISDKYLRSEHCMYELLEAEEKRNLRERIFPIVLADARIYKPEGRLRYIKHWEEKISKLNRAIIESGGLMTGLASIFADLEKYKRIRDSIDHLTDLLRDLNALTPKMHQQGGYVILIDAVQSTLAKISSQEEIIMDRQLASLPPTSASPLITSSSIEPAETPDHRPEMNASVQAASAQVAETPPQPAHAASRSPRFGKDWWSCSPIVVIPLLVAIVAAVATIVSAIINIYPTLSAVTTNTPVPPSPTPSCMSDVEPLVKFHILKNEQEIITINPKEVYHMQPDSTIEVRLEITAANDVVLARPQCTWTNTGTGTDGEFLQKAGCTVVYQSGHTRIEDAISLQVSQPSCPGLFSYAFFILPEKNLEEVP